MPLRFRRRKSDPLRTDRSCAQSINQSISARTALGARRTARDRRASRRAPAAALTQVGTNGGGCAGARLIDMSAGGAETRRDARNARRARLPTTDKPSAAHSSKRIARKSLARSLNLTNICPIFHPMNLIVSLARKLPLRLCPTCCRWRRARADKRLSRGQAPSAVLALYLRASATRDSDFRFRTAATRRHGTCPRAAAAAAVGAAIERPPLMSGQSRASPETTERRRCDATRKGRQSRLQPLQPAPLPQPPPPRASRAQVWPLDRLWAPPECDCAASLGGGGGGGSNRAARD